MTNPTKPEPRTPSRHENGTRTAHASRRRRRRTHVFRPAERCARDVLIGRIRPAPVEGQHYRATCAALAQRRRAGWGQRLVVPRPALLVSLALHRPPARPPSTARPSAPRTGRAPLRVSPRRATSRFSSRIPPLAFLPQAHGPHFPPLMFALGTTFQWGKTSEAAKPDSRPQKNSRRRCPQASRSSRRAARCSVSIWETDVRKCPEGRRGRAGLAVIACQ